MLAKISVTDDEAQAYYDAHKNEFTTPSEIMLREILIDVPATDRGVNVAQDDAAKAKAEDIRQRLLAGEPFPRLAGEVSDAPSKANGGLIGPINSDELAAGIADDAGQDEGRRRHGGHSHAARLSDPEARVADRAEGQELRRGAQRHQRQDRGREAACRDAEVPRAAAGQATITWRNDELKKAYEQALADRKKLLEGEPVAPAKS